MLPRQGVIATLLNTWRQIQAGCQSEETKKHDPNERTDQNSRKKLNKVDISNLSDAEFKTLFIRMLKELSEDLNSIKKFQSERKDTLIEIKNNLQGNKTRMDEVENQINDLKHMEAKKKKN